MVVISFRVSDSLLGVVGVRFTFIIIVSGVFVLFALFGRIVDFRVVKVSSVGNFRRKVLVRFVGREEGRGEV